ACYLTLSRRPYTTLFRSHRGTEGLQVRAGGDLRDHPAEACVLGHRRGHHVGEEFGAPVVVDTGHGDPRLVAGTLDPHHGPHAPLSYPPAPGRDASRAGRTMRWASAMLGR